MYEVNSLSTSEVEIPKKVIPPKSEVEVVTSGDTTSKLGVLRKAQFIHIYLCGINPVVALN